MRSTKMMEGLIHVRLPLSEKQRLIAVARKRGMTLSEFLRDSLAQATGNMAA
jgi:predicted DNA-binding protein